MSASQPDSRPPHRTFPSVDTLDDDWDFEERATIVPAEPLEELARRTAREAITVPPAKRHDSDLDMTPLSATSTQWTSAGTGTSDPDLSQRITPQSPTSWPVELDERPQNDEAAPSRHDSSPQIESQEIDLGLDMRERFSLGDFSGALVLAEAILDTCPGHEEAERYAGSCRDVLRQMYIARLGSLSVVPRVIASPNELRWLAIDHRAGFILAAVDGVSSIEEILDVCGMPSLEALRILYDFAQQRVIGVD